MIMPTYTLPGPEGQELQYQIETLSAGRYKVTEPDGQTFEVDAYEPELGRLHLLIMGRSLDADVREIEAGLFDVELGAENHTIEALNARQHRMRKAGVGARKEAGPELTSPMAGKVVALQAKVGDVVTQGQPVVIVEAMKMENDLKAHRDGVIAAVLVEPGQAVEIGHVLLRIEDQ